MAKGMSQTQINHINNRLLQEKKIKLEAFRGTNDPTAVKTAEPDMLAAAKLEAAKHPAVFTKLAMDMHTKNSNTSIYNVILNMPEYMKASRKRSAAYAKYTEDRTTYSEQLDNRIKDIMDKLILSGDAIGAMELLNGFKNYEPKIK